MNRNKNNNMLKVSFPYFILLIVVIGTLFFFNIAGNEVHDLTTGEFMTAIDKEEVVELTITPKSSDSVYYLEGKLEGYNEHESFKTKIIPEDVEKILKTLDLINENNKRKYKPSNYIVDSLEEKKSYLRGAFLICGSVNDPKTSRYHLEFIIENKIVAYFVNNLLNSLNFNSKVLKREKHYMVYLKESEKISDFIKLLNAYNSLFYYEDIRIYRDHVNMTNRLNNCEQANTDKIVFSSNEQLENIEKLKSMYDFDLLDDKIKEICIYKEKYRESSMQELASIISLETGTKITKSGINHRFRKIKEMITKK